MTTDLQFIANRENAQFSTGPRTPECKKRSRRRAQEKEEMGPAIRIAKTHKMQNLPYDPSEDGFVLSNSQIDQRITRDAKNTKHTRPPDLKLPFVFIRGPDLRSLAAMFQSQNRQNAQLTLRPCRRWLRFVKHPKSKELHDPKSPFVFIRVPKRSSMRVLHPKARLESGAIFLLRCHSRAARQFRMHRTHQNSVGGSASAHSRQHRRGYSGICSQ